MIERNICPIHQVSPRAVSQAISDIVLPEDNTFSTWFLDHAPLILGSALGMFASNIFLYAFRNSGVRALWHVSLHALSSLPSRIQMLAIAAPCSICATYAWMTQLARHIYLLSLYALCQAVILPCLLGSQLLGWAGRVWFGALRVLYTAFRILFTVAFDVLVVDTGLVCLVTFAAKGVTSCSRRMWDWTTDLHDAAVEFVGGAQSTLPSHRADEQPECLSTASPSRLGDSLVGASRASARTIFDSASSRTKKRAVTANFVIAYEVEIAREETRFRFPVATTLHLRIALAGQREGRSNDGSESPGMIDVLQQSESDDGRHLFDRRDPGDGWLVTEAGKDTPDDRRPRHSPGEDIEGKRERFRRQISSVAIPRVVRRNSGWAWQDNASPFRSPPITSPAFWCPPEGAMYSRDFVGCLHSAVGLLESPQTDHNDESTTDSAYVAVDHQARVPT